MPIDVLAGPGCEEVKEDEIDRLAEGRRESFVVIDTPRIYSALGGTSVSPATDTERYRLASYLAATAVRQANVQGLPGVVTTSNGSRARIQALQLSAGGRVYVADPGRAAVCQRLQRLLPNDAARRETCESGLNRWYDRYTPEPGDIQL